MELQVFGHLSPDTDSTGSPIIWSWYLNEKKGMSASPKLLGEPNSEALFVLNRWGFEKPDLIQGINANDSVIIVDTNNPAELPENINDADIQGIIDHHKLVCRKPLLFCFQKTKKFHFWILYYFFHFLNQFYTYLVGSMFSWFNRNEF